MTGAPGCGKDVTLRDECHMTTGSGDRAPAQVGPGAGEREGGQMAERWDLEADVVVIGAGATGESCVLDRRRGAWES
jgi:hypothetical protein